MSVERIDRTLVALGVFGAAFGAAIISREGTGVIARRFLPSYDEPDQVGPGFVRDERPLDNTPPPLPPRPVFAGASAGSGSARPAPINVPKPKQAIEDTCVEPLGVTADDAACKRRAMDGLYAQLAHADGAKVPVRVSYYGDSVSATDEIPGRLRSRLQDVFGDGGPGFVFAAPPHRFNHTLAVDQIARGWIAYAVSTSINEADGLYGVGGSTAESDGDGVIKLKAKTPSGKIAHVDVYYLAQPKGGAADLLVDGDVKATIDTTGDAKKAGWSAIDVDDAEHKVELKVTHGRVRLFGLTLERAPGIVVDNMAIISATPMNEANNKPDQWQEQLAHRGADLVILMLGTNEAEWLTPGKRALGDYAVAWQKLLAPIRAARPDAACLVVSPLDQAEVKDDGTIASRPVMKYMVDVQRKAAQAAGCAFYDTFTWQGGRGAAIRWNRNGWVDADFQHLSGKGTAMVADGLADAILAGYAEYTKR
jgi:lysophospholipase L1-like esterase